MLNITLREGKEKPSDKRLDPTTYTPPPPAFFTGSKLNMEVMTDEHWIAYQELLTLDDKGGKGGKRAV